MRRRGATTIEYGLIASLVLVGLLGAVWALSGGVAALYAGLAGAWP